MRKQSGADERYVLDSSAFLALFEDEEGAETVQELLRRAGTGEIIIFVSFASFAELFYITYREDGPEEAQRRMGFMDRLVTTRVESSPELGLIAGRLKATYRISFADAWIAATAILYDAILVHKDPEFKQVVEDSVKVLELPYKSPTLHNE